MLIRIIVLFGRACEISRSPETPADGHLEPPLRAHRLMLRHHRGPRSWRRRTWRSAPSQRAALRPAPGRATATAATIVRATTAPSRADPARPVLTGMKALLGADGNQECVDLDARGNMFDRSRVTWTWRGMLDYGRLGRARSIQRTAASSGASRLSSRGPLASAERPRRVSHLVPRSAMPSGATKSATTCISTSPVGSRVAIAGSACPAVRSPNTRARPNACIAAANISDVLADSPSTSIARSPANGSTATPASVARRGLATNRISSPRVRMMPSVCGLAKEVSGDPHHHAGDAAKVSAKVENHAAARRARASTARSTAGMTGGIQYSKRMTATHRPSAQRALRHLERSRAAAADCRTSKTGRESSRV